MILLLLLFLATASQAEYIRMNDQIPRTCFGDECLQQIYCWEGHRFADLNQITKQVTARITPIGNDGEELCVDSETDDQLSTLLRSSSMKENAAHRLQNRKPGFSALFTSLVDKLQSFTDTTPAQKTSAERTMTFSAYSLSCVALCKAPTRAPVTIEFTVDGEIKLEAMSLMLVGLVLLLFAPKLSENRTMFYLSGGVLGVLFAVSAVVVLVGFRTLRPTKSQVSAAVMFQFSFCFIRDLVWRWLSMLNLDWVLAYVAVTFTLSLVLVHYMIKRNEGGVNPAFVDFCQLGIQILGVLLIVSPIPSSTLRIVLGFVLVASQLTSHWFKPIANKPTTASLDNVNIDNPFQTPKRRSTAAATTSIPLTVRVPSSHHRISLQEYDQLGREYTDASVKAMLSSPEGKLWLSQNLNRFETQ